MGIDDRLPHFGNVQFCPNGSIFEGMEIPARSFSNLREQIINFGYATVSIHRSGR
jgi:hypothetical protein